MGVDAEGLKGVVQAGTDLGDLVPGVLPALAGGSEQLDRGMDVFRHLLEILLQLLSHFSRGDLLLAPLALVDLSLVLQRRQPHVRRGLRRHLRGGHRRRLGSVVRPRLLHCRLLGEQAVEDDLRLSRLASAGRDASSGGWG